MALYLNQDGIGCIKTVLLCLFLSSCSNFYHRDTSVYDDPIQDVPSYYYKTEPTVPKSVNPYRKPSKNPYDIRSNGHIDNDQYYVAPYYSGGNFKNENPKKELGVEESGELLPAWELRDRNQDQVPVLSPDLEVAIIVSGNYSRSREELQRNQEAKVPIGSIGFISLVRRNR